MADIRKYISNFPSHLCGYITLISDSGENRRKASATQSGAGKRRGNGANVYS